MAVLVCYFYLASGDSGSTNISFDMSGGTGDADLYVSPVCSFFEPLVFSTINNQQLITTSNKRIQIMNLQNKTVISAVLACVVYGINLIPFIFRVEE